MNNKKFLFILSIATLFFSINLNAIEKDNPVKYKPGVKEGSYKTLTANEKIYVVINSFLEIPYEEIGQITVEGSKEFINNILSYPEYKFLKDIKEYKPNASNFADDTFYLVLEYIKSVAREKGGNIITLKYDNVMSIMNSETYIRTFSIGRIDTENQKIYDYYY